MKKINILLAAFAFAYTVNAQTATKDTVPSLYNRIYKNIAAYNIKYASYPTNGAIDDSPFYSTTGFFYEDFLPDLSAKMLFKTDKLNKTYPIKGYDLYEISLDGLRFKNGRVTTYGSGIHPGKTYLVAYNKENGNTKFISGRFFISAIGNDFNINLKDPNSLIGFLGFKLYSSKLQSIKFIKSKRHYFYYSAFSESLNRPAEIVLDVKNIEFPKLHIM